MAKICFVCLKGTSHGDVSFKHAERTIWRKGRAYWLCIGVFLAKMCFECSGGTTHRDFSFEHTEHAFWWEIMNVFVTIKNMFFGCLSGCPDETFLLNTQSIVRFGK